MAGAMDLASSTSTPATDGSTMAAQVTPALRQQIRDVTQRARAAGAVLFYPSTATWHPAATTATATAPRFQVRLCPSLGSKPVGGFTAQSRPGETPSPFLPPDPASLVASFDEWNLVLNKYCVTPGHVLLTRSTYATQGEPLSSAALRLVTQLLALWPREGDAVAFYNAGWRSGASVLHQHVQIMPFLAGDTADDRHLAADAPWATAPSNGATTPSDAAIPSTALPLLQWIAHGLTHDAAAAAAWSRAATATTPAPITFATLPFVHRVVRLPGPCDGATTPPPPAATLDLGAAYAAAVAGITADVDAYVAALARALPPPAALPAWAQARRAGEALSYNVVMTRHVLLVAPRRASHTRAPHRFGVNALGFAGMLLGKEPAACATLASLGIFRVLTEVGVPTAIETELAELQATPSAVTLPPETDGCGGAARRESATHHAP
ncbi:hypothetical protein CXG81DRAFT_19220 [Caulochytrium protostelioides]|uniref:Uncharacterized protein n=1 Tax=Caulochytrium protostelioides TaxID=1555241 RepID=A0A4P9X6S5_9FUNG|nr:hypothetical protein CXG81DRAFT_19220 [Caulochytrium protostelioides]|eukprot:RKP00907.1 hypothetical protein CXG81DRAFT_19220 [Caulochytrium protostelioides]